MMPTKDQIEKAIDNSNQIMATLNALVADDKPYRKQLIMLTKNYPKYLLAPIDRAELINNLMGGILKKGHDNFFFDDEEGLWIFEHEDEEIIVFNHFSGLGEIETTLEFLFCSVVTELESMTGDFPGAIEFNE